MIFGWVGVAHPPKNHYLNTTTRSLKTLDFYTLHAIRISGLEKRREKTARKNGENVGLTIAIFLGGKPLEEP